MRCVRFVSVLGNIVAAERECGRTVGRGAQDRMIDVYAQPKLDAPKVDHAVAQYRSADLRAAGPVV